MTTDLPTLVLWPFRAVRPVADRAHLASRLSPPYDVISAEERSELLAADPNNAVALILPEAAGGVDPYEDASRLLTALVTDGLSRVDPTPALYVYEMATAAGDVTRGLIGAVELRAAEEGVILPHENTMAGPVADRLTLMSATAANLEPIYLVYDGGGAASAVVAAVDPADVIAEAVTADAITHRLWSITDPQTLTAIADDLAPRIALIADGHHRYATYRELQRIRRAEFGHGPWDRGLTLLVDSSSYGPQVHAIHRVLNTVSYVDALRMLQNKAKVASYDNADEALSVAMATDGFAAVITNGINFSLISEINSDVISAINEPADLRELDVVVLHRGLVEQIWGLDDTTYNVGYAHSVEQTLAMAQARNGTAVLLRPTPVEAVTSVASKGMRMPRKSTLFTPKPASGLVIRRFVDEM